jgi:hypothetical protein
MALVLAIEPDILGGILKRIVRELVQAELILVESRDPRSRRSISGCRM